jgi:tetratricopeptide (TPR) repeat protein
LLEQVVARDPKFAPAWAVLAQAYSLIPAFSPALFTGSAEEFRRCVAEALAKAEHAAQRAIGLDPTNADGYTGLATVQTFRRRFIQAEDLFKQALSLDPSNPEALQIYSTVLAAFTAQVLWLNGQDDDAIAMLKALPPNTAFGASSLAEIHAAAGRYGEAADALLTAPSGFYGPGIVETAARLLRTAPAHAASPHSLPRLGQLSFVYLYVGAPERAFEPAEDGDPDAPTAMLLWHSSAAALRKTERFKALVRKAGLVDYWRARGWPDMCRPMGADDFVCD